MTNQSDQAKMPLPARSASSTPSRQAMLALLGLLMVLFVAGCGQDSEAAEPMATSTSTSAQPMPPSMPNATTTPTPTADAEMLDALLAETVPMTDSVALSEEAAEAILVPTPTPPMSLGTVTAALINVRRAPGLDADIVRTETEGEQLEILAVSPDGEWLQVCCEKGDAESQWVAAEFIQVDDDLPGATSTTSNITAEDITAGDEDSKARVIADLVNLRGGPGLAYPVVGQANEGDLLEVVGRSEAGGWWQLCCTLENDGQQQWVSAELASFDENLAAALPVAVAPPVPEGAPLAVGGPEQVAALAATSAPGLPGDGGFSGPGGTNPLTGQPLAGGFSGMRPIVVCINNDYAARPQYGISQADVMYEYIMEGFGITRFSGVYYGDAVSQIGPVRSARLINYYLGALYNAGLACSGASDRVRYTLKHEAPFPYMDVDLDDPSNTRYSVSIGQDYRTRLRTETDKLRRWLGEWGVEQPASLRGFTFGDAGGGAPASTVAIPYPSATGSQVAYAYDAGRGRYLRSMGGAPHLDGNSGAQVGVENVIVQVVPHEITDIVEDSLGSKSIRLNLFGSGSAMVFRDGQAYVGTWRSESRGDLPRFYRDDGSEIRLKPGRSWISVVPPDYSVSYQ